MILFNPYPSINFVSRKFCRLIMSAEYIQMHSRLIYIQRANAMNTGSTLFKVLFNGRGESYCQSSIAGNLNGLKFGPAV